MFAPDTASGAQMCGHVPRCARCDCIRVCRPRCPDLHSACLAEPPRPTGHAMFVSACPSRHSACVAEPAPSAAPHKGDDPWTGCSSMRANWPQCSACRCGPYGAWRTRGCPTSASADACCLIRCASRRGWRIEAVKPWLPRRPPNPPGDERGAPGASPRDSGRQWVAQRQASWRRRYTIGGQGHNSTSLRGLLGSTSRSNATTRRCTASSSSMSPARTSASQSGFQWA